MVWLERFVSLTKDIDSDNLNKVSYRLLMKDNTQLHTSDLCSNKCRWMSDTFLLCMANEQKGL